MTGELRAESLGLVGLCAVARVLCASAVKCCPFYVEIYYSNARARDIIW